MTVKSGTRKVESEQQGSRQFLQLQDLQIGVRATLLHIHWLFLPVEFCSILMRERRHR